MAQPNIDYIIKLSGNQESVKKKLIDVLQYELPIEIDAYHTCMILNKTKQAAGCVHKLKHKIGVLGLEESYHTAEKYENQLRENEKGLQDEFEKILTLILNFVNRL